MILASQLYRVSTIIKNNKNLFTFVSNDFGEDLYKPSTVGSYSLMLRA
jgi:hypothetical protein